MTKLFALLSLLLLKPLSAQTVMGEGKIGTEAVVFTVEVGKNPSFGTATVTFLKNGESIIFDYAAVSAEDWTFKSHDRAGEILTHVLSVRDMSGNVKYKGTLLTRVKGWGTNYSYEIQPVELTPTSHK